MRGLRYLLFTGILTATVSFSNYNCGDDVEGNGSQTGDDSNTLSDIYNPKDADHKDGGLEDRLIYPDENGDYSGDAGIDAGFDSGGDSEIDTGYDSGVDSGSDAQLLDGNDDVPLYDGGMDSAVDTDYGSGLDAQALDSDGDSNQDDTIGDAELDSGDAGTGICDNLYPSDYVIPSPYNMKMPLTDFINYFSAITGFEKIKSLEGQITSDVLLQAAGNDASSMYEIISGNVLFEIDTGICEIGFDKDELNNSYQGAYNK